MRTFSIVLASLAFAGFAAAQTPPTPPTPPAPRTPVPPAARLAPRPPEFQRHLLEEIQREALERTHEMQWRLQADLMEHLEHNALERIQHTQDLQRELQDRLAHIQPELEARLSDLHFQIPALPPVPPLPPLPALTWGPDELPPPGATGQLHRLRPEQGTPQDSLYRLAREALNRGDYARAASLFQSVEQKYPRSRVAPAALYYQAFALYRSGANEQLRTAIEALKAQQEKYPEAAADPDAAALRTRVYAALAARGDAQAAAAVRAAGTTGPTCDEEEMAVRAEALSSLTQLDPEGASAALKRVLARRDECSVSLRRRAVYLLGRAGTEVATSDLFEVARTDPDPAVRSDAISILGRSSFTSVSPSRLLQLFNDNPDERTRQAVLSAFRSRGDAESRRSLRTIIERTDVPERLRAQAISSLAGDRFVSVDAAVAREIAVVQAARARAGEAAPVVAVAPRPGQTPIVTYRPRTGEGSLAEEDAAFLRTLYGRTDSRTIKSAIIAAVAKGGGSANQQWLLGIAKNPGEEGSLRREALSRLKQDLSVEDLGGLYESITDRELRTAVVDQLASRPEAAATDKLIGIAKSTEDPRVRSRAIRALTTTTRKQDPKVIAFIREFVEKP